ncbi:hypothetical protein HID58_081861 [Brassica napus]|uniref:Uncharacterized protein n=1 Tax=Brassica napus TaxID=3708 RepID=A0ABQ7Y8V7_BRANA|nr:hypothetical protein HID58_081861 [Brassica napus]
MTFSRALVAKSILFSLATYHNSGGYVYLHSFMILLVKKVQFHRFQKPATLQAAYFGAIDHQLLKPFKFTSQLSRSQACRPRRKITLGGSTTPPWTVSRQNTHGKFFANVVPCNFEHPTYGSKELPKTCILNSINQSYSTFSESIMLPGNRSRNQSSGAKNNKKARQDEVIKSQANDLLKYVTRKSSKADEICKTEEDKEDEELGFEDVDEKTYCVRSERNKLLHYNISTPPGTISKLLDTFIRDDVLSKRNKQSSGLMQHWLVND